jgi:hypothetical protein
MKEFTQLQKIISVLMIFGVMIEFTGCYSARPISTNEIMPTDKNLIHTSKYNYPVDSVKISDGVLTGKVDMSNKDYKGIVKNNIYLFSDTAVKFNNDIITIPLDKVSTVERMLPDQKKTRNAIIVTSAIGAGILVIVITGIAINQAQKKVQQETKEVGDAIADLLETMCTDW